MLHKLLFETKLGEWLLCQLEHRAALAVVSVNWLGDQAISPTTDVESDAGPEGTGMGLISDDIVTPPGTPDKAPT
jgi:hypothetical protein